MVPAKTSPPGALSTGADSPVMGAWFTADRPLVTRPSTGMRSAGRTSTVAPTGTCSTGTSVLDAVPDDAGLAGCEIAKRLDGVSGAPHRVVLERVGQ